MATALEGIKVLDLSTMWAAPSSAMYLADQGADVIKVEPPEGDDARHLLSHPALGNESPSFLVVNRSKRGIVVDIRKPQGREIVHKLAEQADVLIHNFRPKVAHRLGLSYQEMELLNPRLVYVQLSAYGPEGPYADRPGYDLLVQALSGMMHRRAPDGTPIGAGIWAADCSTPMALAYGIAVALLVRERTGHGQKVETSLLHVALAMQHVDLVRPEQEPPGGRAPANQATFSPYRASDGEWLLPIALSDKEWVKLCRVLEVPHLEQESAFATMQARGQHAEELFPILEALFAAKPRGEWLQLLEHGDVPCAPIASRDEVFSQPQSIENGMISEVVHPTAGRTKMISPPVRLSANPPRVPGPSPLQGQHTAEVLREIGYDEGAIQALRVAEVIP